MRWDDEYDERTREEYYHQRADEAREAWRQEQEAMSTQPPPAPASPAQERCAECGIARASHDFIRGRGEIAHDFVPPAAAPLVAAWEDGWKQRHALSNAPLGTRIVERRKRMAEFLQTQPAPSPSAGTPPATVTPEAKSLSAAATGESPASGSTVHAGPPPVGEPALDVERVRKMAERRRWHASLMAQSFAPFSGGLSQEMARCFGTDALDALALEALLADHARLRDALAQAQRERDEARHVVCETLWMAGRYADGRRSYAVGMYNDARRKAEAGGYAADAKPAVDGDSPDWPTLVERAEAAEATLAQARAEFWREAAQVAREWALGGDNPLDDVNVVLRQLADQMDQRATPTPAPPQE